MSRPEKPDSIRPAISQSETGTGSAGVSAVITVHTSRSAVPEAVSAMLRLGHGAKVHVSGEEGELVEVLRELTGRFDVQSISVSLRGDRPAG